MVTMGLADVEVPELRADVARLVHALNADDPEFYLEMSSSLPISG